MRVFIGCAALGGLFVSRASDVIDPIDEICDDAQGEHRGEDDERDREPEGHSSLQLNGSR